MTGNGKSIPQTLPVYLPADLADFVREQVAAKTFFDPSHLIAEALYHYRDQVLANGVKLEELRAMIRVGLDEADRGELLDGPTVMARLRAKLGVARGQPT